MARKRSTAATVRFVPRATYLPSTDRLRIQLKPGKVSKRKVRDGLTGLYCPHTLALVGIVLHEASRFFPRPYQLCQWLSKPSENTFTSVSEYMDSVGNPPVAAWHNPVRDVLEVVFEGVDHSVDTGVHPRIHLLRSDGNRRVVGVHVHHFRALISDPEVFLRQFRCTRPAAS